MSKPTPPPNTTPNPYRFKAEWNHFYRRVLPDGVSEIQITEMRRAYYAGAEAALRLMLMGLEHGGTEATDADLRLMDHFHQELNEFGEQLKRGEA